MITPWLILLSMSLVSACPKQCFCDDTMMYCKVPGQRSMPLFDDVMNTTLLNLSDNNILDIPRDSVKNFPKLENLILDGNKLYYLKNGVFKNIPNLKKLSIESNNLHFIENEVFEDLPLLEELYLGKNSLTNLPNLKKNKVLKVICISFNNINVISDQALTDNILLTELKLANNKLTSLPRSAFPDDVTGYAVLSLVGNNFRNIPDVVKEMTGLKKLSLCHNPLKIFPVGEFSVFKNLMSLSMTNIGLYEIQENTFYLPKLEELFIGRNQLTARSLASLQLPSLKILVVNNNKIGDIPGNTLAGFPVLEMLDLSESDVGQVDQYSFKLLSELKKVDLHGNRLHEVPSFVHNTELEEINLNDNNISSVRPSDFSTLKLKKLSLSNNNLSSFKSISKSLVFLEYLDLSHNDFDHVPRVTIRNLVTLNVSHNHIRNLSELSFSGLSKLKTLNLVGNDITDLPDHVFQTLDDLTSLYICKNRLSKLNPKALKSLTHLREFVSNQNNLTTIDRETFSQNLRLERIYLNYNRLDQITVDSFADLKELKELWLRYNKLSVLPRLQDNAKLQSLGLCGNPLKSIPAGALNGLIDLEVLLLKETDLEELSPRVINHPRNINYLNLAEGNRFTSIPKVIKKMPSLEKLKLSGNPIESVFSSDFYGLNNLRELWLDGMKLQFFDVFSIFSILPGIRKLRLGMNPWHCGCDIEWFALGVDGQRSDVTIEDRDVMVCATPPRFAGRRLDFLRLDDFSQCEGSFVKAIDKTSVIMSLPLIQSLAQDYNSVHHQIIYKPLHGGKENILEPNQNKREVLVDGLIPSTNYIVCVKTFVSSTKHQIDNENILEFPTENREMCHQIKTSDLKYGKTDKSPNSKHLVATYVVLGAIAFFILFGTTISTTFWCRRANTKNNEDFHNLDSNRNISNGNKKSKERDSVNEEEETVKEINDTNGIDLISKSEFVHVNELGDELDKRARTKL